MSHPLVKEFLDEGFPEVFFDSFGLQHQAVMKLTQLIYEAECTRGRTVVFTAEVLRETCRTPETPETQI